eukprot:g41259.t1
MKVLENIAVGCIVVMLSVALVLCEALHLVLKSCRSKGTSQPKKTPRRIVLFDGLCVMCNGFARFCMARVVHPSSVDFIPYQDLVKNNHAKSKTLLKEFPDLSEETCSERLAIISGNKLVWGSDSVLEVLSWCFAPYPLFGAVGKAVPYVIRDRCYMLVSKNRYSWFGMTEKMWTSTEKTE